MPVLAPVRHTEARATALSSLGASLAERPYARRGAPVVERPTRLLIVEPQALVRAALRQLLRQSADAEVIGDVADVQSALGMVASHHPEAVLLGAGHPLDSILGIIRQLTAVSSAPRVLVLSPIPEEEALIEVLDAGASGYLTTDAAEPDMIEAIRVIASGEVYVRPRVARLLATHQQARTRSPREQHRAAYERLSQRERAVVERLAQGFAGVEIGRQLGISNKTVETYKERIGDKLGLRHRTEYVRFALEIGLLHR